MIYKVPVGDVLDVHYEPKGRWHFSLLCGYNAEGGRMLVLVSSSIIAADEQHFAFVVPDDNPLCCCERHMACAIKKEET